MDPFFSLTNGIFFDKKKYDKDVRLFEAKKTQKQIEADSLIEKTELPVELDFFNTQPVLEKPKKEEIEINIPAVKPIKDEKTCDRIRRRHKIRVYGSDISFPILSMAELIQENKISTQFSKNLLELPYTELTPIQMQTIPLLLEGRDVLACAPTGTGKTMAFAIPIITKLETPCKNGCRAVVLSPTKELAQQIYTQFQRLSQGTELEIQLLNKNTTESAACDVVIATPLSLVRAINEEKINLTKVQHLVFDEGDKLFELGLVEQVDTIIAACTVPSFQKVLFSATLPSGIESLAASIMSDIARVVVGTKSGATVTIKQELVYAGQEAGKLVAIRQLIQKGFSPPALVFVQSISRAEKLFQELCYGTIKVGVIHACKSQRERETTLAKFRSGEIWLLITTELMARGLDFQGVDLVINYDFPQSSQSYVHRIGRTGRAGRPGHAITFFTDPDSKYISSVVNIMRQARCPFPKWMLNLKQTTQKAKKELRTKPLKREAITSKCEVRKKSKPKKGNKKTV